MKWMFATFLSVSVCSCGLIKETGSCNFKAKNLRAEPRNGSSLQDNSISLAFLKGPSSATSEIGSLLEARGIQASFFVRGAAVEDHSDSLSLLRQQGHLIGNGGYTFTDLTRSTEPVLEVRKTDALITADVTGDIFLLHAPQGEFNTKTADLLNRNGLGKYVGPIAADTVASELFVDDAACWEANLSVAVCAQQYFNEIVRVKKGIIPLHDQDSRTLSMLDILLPDLQAFGFSFVRLDRIPDIRVVLDENGSRLDEVDGQSSCDDYE